jgi:phthiodiolone/phenolphthiodiolone dimycocerosates ketoreductase
MPTLSVGSTINCIAPLRLDRATMRLLTSVMRVESLFVPDHYLGFIPRSVWSPEATPAAKMVPTPDAFFDPFVMLGMMAARYRRVRIGTGVTEPFRRHPATLAQAFVTLDHITGGRAILGIGNGERENIEPWGLAFTKRVARLEEALAIIRKLWASGGEPVDFDGRFWRLRRALFATPLYQGKPPALWIAAHAPRMLGLTGRFADGWLPTIKMTPTEYRERLGRIAAAASEAGRNLEGFEPSLLMQVAIGRSRAEMLETMARSPVASAMAMLLPAALWTRQGLSHPLGDDFEGFPDFVPEEITPEQLADARRQVTPALIGDAIVAGSVDEIVAEVRGLVGAGLRHVVVWNLGPLAVGAGLNDLLRLNALVRRLQKLEVPPLASVLGANGSPARAPV